MMTSKDTEKAFDKIQYLLIKKKKKARKGNKRYSYWKENNTSVIIPTCHDHIARKFKEIIKIIIINK